MSCKVTLQPYVALSTINYSEEMTLTEATKETIWLKRLVSDRRVWNYQALAYCNSMSAICLDNAQVFNEQTIIF